MKEIPGVILEPAYTGNIDKNKIHIYVLISFIPVLIFTSIIWWII